MSPNKKCYRARWVVPVTAPPIENGILIIQEGRILEIGKGHQFHGDVIDLGDVAILPGLVNAHTHLEFSDLPAPLGTPGIEFTDWIRLVVKNRMDRVASSDEAGQPSSKRDILQKGLAESVDAGVVAIGEIASLPTELTDYQGHPVDVTVFLELLGRNPADVRDRLATARQFLAEDVGPLSSPNPIRTALSPHAPYSVHPQLFDGLVPLATQTACPLAMHLGETPAELELVAQRSGPFVDLLKDLNAWFPDTFDRNQTMDQYLSEIGRCRNGLVVHGNFLTDMQIDQIAGYSSTSVVYCPRTHHFFGHPSYPLPKLLAAGVNVALGTDSRASNPDLNLFAEIKHVHDHHPSATLDQVLAMGTINGAKALGIENRFGSLEVGKSDRLCVVAMPVGCQSLNEMFITDSVNQVQPLDVFETRFG